MDLTLLDGFILLVVLAGLIRGFTVGAVRQIASLVGIVAALLAAGQLMHTVGALLVESLGLSEAVAPVAGFVLLFVTTWLLFVGVARLLEQLLETLSLSFLNRAAGGVVGGVQAGLLLSVLFLVLLQADIPDREVRNESVLYGPVAGALPATLAIVSEHWPAAKRMSETFGREIRPRIQPAGRSEGDRI